MNQVSSLTRTYLDGVFPDDCVVLGKTSSEFGEDLGVEDVRGDVFSQFGHQLQQLEASDALGRGEELHHTRQDVLLVLLLI